MLLMVEKQDKDLYFVSLVLLMVKKLRIVCLFFFEALALRV
jgi:hypothetical protein